MIGYAEALLGSMLPERDPLAEQVAALVSGITDDPGCAGSTSCPLSPG